MIDNTWEGFNYDAFQDGKIWLPFTISYNGETKKMTYSLKAGNKSLTQKTSFSDSVPTQEPYMNFAMAAAGDYSAGTQNVKITSLNFSAVGVVNVHYLDADTNQEIDGAPVKTLKGSLNKTATIDPQISKMEGMGYRLYKVDAPKSYNYDKNTLPFGGDTESSNIPFQDVLQDVKFYFKKGNINEKISVKVIHVDADNNNKVIGKDTELTGKFGTTISIPQQSIDGYTSDASNPTSLKFGSLDKDGKTVTQITLKYHQANGGSASTPSISDSSSNSSSLSSSSSSTSSTSSSSSIASSISSSGSSNNTSLPNYAAAKGTVVYAINKIGLYGSTDFSTSNRQIWYAKKPRIHRPMFVVTGYSRNINGRLRYQVKDVNHTSKTDGKTGYITASQKYVRPVYYATKHATITVINPCGVNAYRKANLTGRVRNYRQGTVLHVKQIVKHNLTTRYVLTNGRYVTANRKLVAMGRHKQVKMVKTKRAINRYRNVNLTKQNRTITKNRTLKVYGYDYSHGSDIAKHGTLRYRVASGYITANTKYVRAYK